jgi:signal transduction histidine kinase
LTDKNTALEAEISERKRIEGELAEMQRRLLDHVENERLELARDLHDGPMQELYALAFQIDLMPAEFENGQISRSVETAKERLMQVIHSLRSISRELRPPALAPYGLEKAIRSHAANIQQIHPDLKIEMHLDADGRTLPEEIRLALYRIFQTAISNVLRHAQATHVTIRFHLDDSMALLEIRDNGRGFEVPRRWITLARQGHMGLVGAAERAEAAGGTLVVESRQDVGTTIKVFVPRGARVV